MRRKQSRKLQKKDINKNNFILDVLIGMGLGILVVMAITIMSIGIRDLVNGDIPLMGLVRELQTWNF